jgi:hypothetical protein
MNSAFNISPTVAGLRFVISTWLSFAAPKLEVFGREGNFLGDDAIATLAGRSKMTDEQYLAYIEGFVNGA